MTKRTIVDKTVGIIKSDPEAVRSLKHVQKIKAQIEKVDKTESIIQVVILDSE